MVRIFFGKVPDSVPVPLGTFLCRLVGPPERPTRGGRENPGKSVKPQEGQKRLGCVQLAGLLVTSFGLKAS